MSSYSDCCQAAVIWVGLLVISDFHVCRLIRNRGDLSGFSVTMMILQGINNISLNLVNMAIKGPLWSWARPSLRTFCESRAQVSIIGHLGPGVSCKWFMSGLRNRFRRWLFITNQRIFSNLLSNETWEEHDWRNLGLQPISWIVCYIS
jgi:hypothetical protein